MDKIGFCELNERKLNYGPDGAPWWWGLDPYWLFQHPSIALLVYLAQKQYYFGY